MWLATIANVRIHGETHQWAETCSGRSTALWPLNVMPYDTGRCKSQRASSQFRVELTATIIRCRPSMPASG
ncbi:MAG: hypothetical protein KF778_20965 [Rhodocyclaceae bacterium]|nr:hypothetical protein [Rhodocyclaceae bacterium]